MQFVSIFNDLSVNEKNILNVLFLSNGRLPWMEGLRTLVHWYWQCSHLECGKDVIYSQDLGYSILGLRILNPGNLVLGLRFKDPES